jgi:hypothetical protein
MLFENRHETALKELSGEIMKIEMIIYFLSTLEMIMFDILEILQMKRLLILDWIG